MSKKFKKNHSTRVFQKTLPAVFLLLLTISLFSPDNFAQEQKVEVKVEAPKILAVEFYADWCAACKELMPKMAEIRKSYQNKQVMVVRFDMTDDYTKAQGSFMASYSGLEEVYKKANGKTGLIALVDVKTKQIYGVINKTKNPEDINKMIDDAIAKAESTK